MKLIFPLLATFVVCTCSVVKWKTFGNNIPKLRNTTWITEDWYGFLYVGYPTGTSQRDCRVGGSKLCAGSFIDRCGSDPPHFAVIQCNVSAVVASSSSATHWGIVGQEDAYSSINWGSANSTSLVLQSIDSSNPNYPGWQDSWLVYSFATKAACSAAYLDLDTNCSVVDECGATQLQLHTDHKGGLPTCSVGHWLLVPGATGIDISSLT
jgi:hypothetical protein